MIPFPFQAGQLGYSGTPDAMPPLIDMQFDAGNGSTVFSDNGTGASTWTGSSGSVVCSTAVVLDGISSLLIPSTSSYLTADYTSGNRIPATADWDIIFRVRVASSTSIYMLSAQNSTATAAGTAIAIATNAGNQLQVVLSDGSTRSVVVAGAAGTVISGGSTNYLIEVRRRGSTISLYRNGVLGNSGTFSGSVNFPSSEHWRIGAPKFSNVAPTTMYFDTFKVVSY